MNLEREMLEALDQVEPLMMFERVLVSQMRMQGHTQADAEGALRRLEQRSQVIGITTDDGRKWKISTAGKARLCE